MTKTKNISLEVIRDYTQEADGMRTILLQTPKNNYRIIISPLPSITLYQFTSKGFKFIVVESLEDLEDHASVANAIESFFDLAVQFDL